MPLVSGFQELKDNLYQGSAGRKSRRRRKFKVSDLKVLSEQIREDVSVLLESEETTSLGSASDIPLFFFIDTCPSYSTDEIALEAIKQIEAEGKIDELLSMKDGNGQDLLSVIVKNNCINTADYLTKYPEIFHKVAENGDTFLHETAKQRTDRLLSVVKDKIDFSGIVDTHIRNNETAMQVCIGMLLTSNSSIEIMKQLLDMGADPNQISENNRNSALHIAANIGDETLTQKLLDKGADLFARNVDGLYPVDLTDSRLCYGSRRDNVREMLVAAGGPQLVERIDDPIEDVESVIAAIREVRLKHNKPLELTPEVIEELEEISNTIQSFHANKEITQRRTTTLEEAEEETERLRAEEPNKFHFIEKAIRDDGFLITSIDKLTEEQENELARLRSPVENYIQKSLIGWELVQRKTKKDQLNEYLDSHDTISVTIPGVEQPLSFVDLSGEDEDYQFIVNTFPSKTEQLDELQRGDPAFFESTPFISCSLIDKQTKPFYGKHQMHHIFPISLVLEVPPEQIAYMAPIDIASPYRCNAKGKLEYLEKTEGIRAGMDIRQAHYQAVMVKVQDKPAPSDEPAPRDDNVLIPPPPSFAIKHLRKDQAYHSPQLHRAGREPAYTAERLQRMTGANSYNELLVKGNVYAKGERKVRGSLLLVDKKQFDEFMESYPRLNEVAKREADSSLASLRALTHPVTGRFKLALIETDVYGYKSKMPVDKQLDLIEEQIKESTRECEKARVYYKRQTESDGGEATIGLGAEFERLSENLEKLKALRQGLMELAQPEIEKGRRKKPE